MDDSSYNASTNAGSSIDSGQNISEKFHQLNIVSKILNTGVTNVQDSKMNVNGDTDIRKFIPPIPESYSFVDENFISDSFSVDGFVKRNSKRVSSLEQLKEHLTAYLKTLKHSMVELINEDYTEFINLSSNLVSFDKSINNIKTPIIKFKDETSQVQAQIEDIIVLLNLKQNRLKTIRNNKLKLNMILEIGKYLERVDANLQEIFQNENNSDNRKSGSIHIYYQLSESSTLIFQMNHNFEYLLENQHLDDKHSNQFVSKLKEKFDKLSGQFYHFLEKEVIRLLTFDFNNFTSEQSLDEHLRLIEKIFRIYLLNGNQSELERIICKNIVKPCFDSIVNDSYIAKNGVKSMFDKIIQFIDSKCVLLIKVSTNDETGECLSISKLGFELITATIWNQFVECCTVRAGSLFSLANVDTFHHNYSSVLQFIEEFIAKTCLQQYRTSFEHLPSYHKLKSKFNLNVYFYMRLQQIAPKLEKSFTDNYYSLASSEQQQLFRMNITQLVYNHIDSCWPTSEHRYIGDLFGYLWKITLKIIARFCLWLRTITAATLNQFIKSSYNIQMNDPSQHKRLLHQTMGALIYDSQMFVNTFTSLYQATIAQAWSRYYQRLLPQIRKKESNTQKMEIGQFSLDESFNEAMAQFRTVGIGNLIQLLKREIISECNPILNYVNDIPRLYRRTNKDKPSKASVYIDNCFEQLLQFKSLIGLNSNSTNNNNVSSSNDDWIVQVINDLAVCYKNATLEVLTSVQKTEDSLKKLKKAKSNSKQFPNSSNSIMSDDDKIRLQIYYDVDEFGKQMKNKLNLSASLVKPYQDLSSMVSSLKILT